MLLVTFVLSAVPVLWVRRRRGYDRSAAWGLAGVLLFVWLFGQAYCLRPSKFTITGSLPLHWCDLAGLIAAGAVVTSRRWPRTLLFYWSLTFSVWAFMVPVVREGVNHPGFWIYWLTHAAIAVGLAFDVVARGYRPTWRDCRVAVRVTAAVAGGLILFNAVTGTHYGYLGGNGGRSRMLEAAFGPWPARLPVLIGVTSVVYVGLTLPFTGMPRPPRRVAFSAATSIENHPPAGPFRLPVEVPADRVAA